MKIVYVTGCLGFIGRHVTQLLLDKGWYVYGIDNCTYASDTNFLKCFQSYKNFNFERKNICDIDRLVDCDYFINIAAETHVDNSIRDIRNGMGKPGLKAGNDKKVSGLPKRP